MPCALTSNYLIDCKDSLGGVKQVWFANFSDITGVTEASGVVTAISKATGKKFYSYQLIRNTASLTETPTGSLENGTMFFQQQLTIILNKMQASTRNELNILSRATLMAVVQDNNGKYWLLGRTNGIDMNGGQHTTGTANGDRNGYELTFIGEEGNMMPEVQASVIATLTA